MDSEIEAEHIGTDFEFRTLYFPVLALAGIVFIGDWLLWGHDWGVSFAFYLAVVGAGHALLNFKRLHTQSAIFGFLALFLALLPVIEVFNSLSFLIAGTGTFIACMIFRGGLPNNWAERIELFAFASLFSISRFPRFVNFAFNHGGQRNLITRMSVWILPIIFAGVFILLFAEANPVLQQWLEAIDLASFVNFVFSARFIFIVALAWITCPFIEQKMTRFLLSRSIKQMIGFKNSQPNEKHSSYHQAFFGTGFFERSLILFNIIFALQTLLDLTYLYGGMGLPDGMSYASYAHRGAYPLVAASLLAGLFALIALRPGGAGEKSSTVKWMMYIWLGQNLMLVGSSIFRLNLYIEAYKLSYWRIAALIWMAMVAAGLVLIIARFVLKKDFGWLFSANLAILLGTLYMTSFVNLPGFIASYNLRHSSLVVKNGPKLDWHYLETLGVSAYPAVLRVQNVMEQVQPNTIEVMKLERVSLVLKKKSELLGLQNWRSWSFRNQRSAWAIESSSEQRTESRVQ